MTDAAQTPQQEADKPFIVCIGTGCMTKCDDCQHYVRWQTISELDHALYTSMMESAIKVNTSACQITNGRYYDPPAGKANKEGGDNGQA